MTAPSKVIPPPPPLTNQVSVIGGQSYVHPAQNMNNNPYQQNLQFGQAATYQQSQYANQALQNQFNQWGGLNAAQSIPRPTPSLDFTVDMIFAAVEKHLRSVIREEITIALRSERPYTDTVLAPGLQSGESKQARRSNETIGVVGETA